MAATNLPSTWRATKLKYDRALDVEASVMNNWRPKSSRSQLSEMDRSASQPAFVSKIQSMIARASLGVSP